MQNAVKILGSTLLLVLLNSCSGPQSKPPVPQSRPEAPSAPSQEQPEAEENSAGAKECQEKVKLFQSYFDKLSQAWISKTKINQEESLLILGRLSAQTLHELSKTENVDNFLTTEFQKKFFDWVWIDQSQSLRTNMRVSEIAAFLNCDLHK